MKKFTNSFYGKFVLTIPLFSLDIVEKEQYTRVGMKVDATMYGVYFGLCIGYIDFRLMKKH